jgi:hypothetical protein
VLESRCWIILSDIHKQHNDSNAKMTISNVTSKKSKSIPVWRPVTLITATTKYRIWPRSGRKTVNGSYRPTWVTAAMERLNIISGQKTITKNKIKRNIRFICKIYFELFKKLFYFSFMHKIQSKRWNCLLTTGLNL